MNLRIWCYFDLKMILIRTQLESADGNYEVVEFWTLFEIVLRNWIGVWGWELWPLYYKAAILKLDDCKALL